VFLLRQVFAAPRKPCLLQAGVRQETGYKKKALGTWLISAWFVMSHA